MAVLCQEIRLVVPEIYPQRFLSSAAGAEPSKRHRQKLTFLLAHPGWTDSSRLASHSVRCPSVGLRLFKKNVTSSVEVIRRAAAGYRLDKGDKAIVRHTVYDCLKFASLWMLFLVPFAQILLPVVVVKFPRMVPSTFLETGCCADSLVIAQKRQRRLAQAFHQQIQDVKISDLLKDANFPHANKILDFQKGQAKTLQLNAMSNHQLQSLAKLLGVKPTKRAGLLKWRLRHCMRRIRNEDRNHMWEGVDQLSKLELAEACQKRVIPFHGLTETEMRTHLERWACFSSKRDISMCLLLWIQSSFNLNCRCSLMQQDMFLGEAEMNEVTNARCPTESLEVIYRNQLEALSLRHDIT